MKKFLWVFLPFVILFIVLSTLWHFSEKKISYFLRDKIKAELKASTQWNLEIENIQLELVPPRATVSQIQLTPPPHVRWMTPLKLEHLSGSIDLLSLLAGQIRFSLIQMKGIDTELTLSEIPPSPKPMEILPIAEIFDALQFIQVKLLLLDKTSLKIKMNKRTPPVQVTGGILLQNTPQTIHYTVKAQAEGKINTLINHSLNTPAFSDKIATLNLESKGSLSPKSLRINSFVLASSQSKLELQGEFINFAKVITQPHFSGLVDLTLDGDNFINWLHFTELNKNNLKAEGTLRASGKVDIEKWSEPALDLKIDLKEAKLNEFQLGSLQSQIQIEKSQVSTEEIHFNHPSGELVLKESRWNIQKDLIKSKLDLKKLDLQKLFIELGLKDIPVELKVSALVQCEGGLINDFKLNCQGKVQGSDLNVRSAFRPPSTTIIALPEFSGEGSVSIDLNEVKYDTSVLLSHSQGHSQGVVHFQNGFVIDFNSNNFDFQDAPQIAGLNFEGKAQLQGRTQGGTQSATLDIALTTDNFWFENFGLGTVKGKLGYEKGHLLIEAPQAQLFQSQYLAQIDVDLSHSRIKGLVESPKLNAADAITALRRRVPIPFDASGTGHTRAQFEGPFSLGKLSYNFEGVLNKGDIQGESFDELNWHWKSTDGQVQIENNTLQKGNALITVNGTSTPTGHLDLAVEGNNFKLEESTYLPKYIKTIAGDVQFKMSVKNHILKPDINLNGKINHTVLGDSDLPDSTVHFSTDADGLAMKLGLLGDQLQLNLSLPYDKQVPAHLHFDIQKFNFADFLALMMGSPLLSEYNSLLTAKMDLTSKDNNLFKGTGFLNINNFSLSRNENTIKNEKPMIIEFNNGNASLRDFVIRGPKTEIKVEGDNFNPNQLKINLKGSTDVHLFQLFTPFIDTMNGPIYGNIKIAGSLQSPEVYGNVDINELSLRIKGFPALFDHMSSHLEFSQKRIIIDSLRGSMGGGSLQGNGTITINGMRDVPIDIKAQLRNVQLEVPEHIQSSGSADIILNGNWFPYTLSGSYRVNQAFIDKDFSSEANGNSVRQSIYLPKNIVKSDFEPLTLDLQVNLEKKVEIKNPQIAGFLSGQIQIKGPTQSPLLFGTIKTLPSAQLFFRDKIFDIQSGIIKFNDPVELNPELFFTARSLVDKYEINLLLQGKAKMPQLTLTSQPPLEEQDIISLLALGFTSQKLDSQIQTNQQAAQMGSQIGAAIMSANPLNKEIKQSLGVDVKFSANYDDTKNETVNKVTASKELIPKKLNATATLSDSQRDVRFQYLINDRLSSVLTFETNENQSASSTSSSSQPASSIFGLDLEYKVEFK